MIKSTDFDMRFWAYAFLVILCFVSDFTFALEVVESEDEVAVRDDGELVLNCTGDEPWDYCRWIFYSRDCARPVGEVSDPTCNIDSDRITWRGVPTIDNRCTIAVSDLTLADSGVWTCQLITGQDTVDVAPKNYKVSIYSKGAVSFASRPHQRMLVGTTYVVECAGVGGVPAPDLRASVGPRLVEGLEETLGLEEMQLEAIEDGGDGLLGGTVTRLFKYSPTPDNVEMFVKCSGVQMDRHGETVYEAASVKLDFDVIFPPLAPEDQEDLPSFYLEEGRSTEVTLNFSANPAPRDDQVIWHILGDGDGTNDTVTLSAGDARDRFEARHVQVDGSYVSATLFIHQATYEDMRKYCYMEANTDLGRQEFEFTLKPMPMESIDEYEGEGNDDSGLSVGAIVGIVLGCVLFFVAVIILLIFLRKTERCCFSKGKSAKFPGGDEYLSVGQRDNEAARPTSSSMVTTTIPEEGNVGGNIDATYISRDEVDDEVGPMLRRREEENTVGEGNDLPRPGRTESYQIATGIKSSISVEEEQSKRHSGGGGGGDN